MLTHHEADRAIARANRRDFQAFGCEQSSVRVKPARLLIKPLAVQKPIVENHVNKSSI